MRRFLASSVFLVIMLLSACGNNEPTDASEAENEADTFTYESETGPVEVPTNPEKIIALTNGPNVFALDGNVVGIDEWTSNNPLFQEKVEGVEIVSEESLEKILELEPDLIIAGSHMNNIDKLNDIAPTVVYTWGELDYLTQQIEIGKLLNKEEEATEWVEDFTERAEATGEAIREEIGEDATVSVFESGNKEVYVFGNNYARGTEILYQAMALNMPEKVEKEVLEAGVYTLSPEIIPEFAGDYIIFSKNNNVDNSFLETETWHNIPAVKNNRVFEIDSAASTYSDPITLEYLLEIFESSFLTH
ncbi:iron-hydroxamate ABC transporter substrate-binding protein [Salipaludibacillus agaradhaerens]|uniref:iron-hydroxamate ABC transporter substrate-binding protein n=1 Tax=Salipaludibacillus agaradhaerens TaxID=76935 RepID=UPI0021513956|nr:iron-hydroxamate ABC transporter substrate-binding protein [Salipaludibacillus agaradhaerens]MCR6105430.1 iron-hydroxamate ABC transporter substrate-binding protein [Salipaludibacillus agaradhaerens]MCR6117469.1 iron-hydroxamate ABC transporter substrate-binding protein [Salipaludibacillus agaradhaerens]UJW56658.1 iron-hydroxamate ABC transporter substrate-binding protein [Bacillus sp. A116_S68]